MIWKEAVMASSQRLPGGTQEKHKKPHSGWVVSWPSFEPSTSKIEVQSITTRPTCSVCCDVLLLINSIQPYSGVSGFCRILFNYRKNNKPPVTLYVYSELRAASVHKSYTTKEATKIAVRFSLSE
jgi:hypothetical protein